MAGTEPQRRQRKRRRSNVSADQVVGDSCKALRERRGLSQQRLADDLGWNQSTIARIEAGQRSVSVADLLGLCWALNVAPIYMLDGSFQTGDVPVHEGIRVPTPHMRAWIRGGEPLPGMNYRAYFENIPDDEWLKSYGPVSEQRAASAQHWEQAEELLASGASVRPGREQEEAELSPELRAELAEERRIRKAELDAARRTRRAKGGKQ